MTPDYLTKQIINFIPKTKSCGIHNWYALPACPLCGKPNKFYFNVTGDQKKRKGYHCKSAGCNSRGTIEKLVGLLRKQGYPIVYHGEAPSMKTLTDYYEQQQNDAPLDKPCIIPFPKEALPVSKLALPAYFTKQRGYDGQLLIDLGLKYCREGFYAGRILIPLRTHMHRAFLAYATKRSQSQKKVMYPLGCEISRFIFPYNYVVRKKPKFIVICEGSTDALRILMHCNTGEVATWPLALLGKNMSSYQRDSIVKLVKANDTEVIICLDADARSAMSKIINDLSSRIGKDRISFIDWYGLPSDIIQRIDTRISKADPDDIKDVQVWTAMINSRRQARTSLV